MVADDRRRSAREGCSYFGKHSSVHGQGDARKLRKENWPEPGEQADLKERGGFVLNKAGVITAISADITPVVRQSPQHSIILVPRGPSAMQKMNFPADHDSRGPPFAFRLRDSEPSSIPD